MRVTITGYLDRGVVGISRNNGESIGKEKGDWGKWWLICFLITGI